MTTGTDTTKAQQEGSSVADAQCAGTIPIIPVRYAIVPRKDDSQPDYLYADKDCGAHLEQGFEKLSRSIYTVRALRPGYIYLYDETKGTLFIWEADGKGNYTEMRYTSLENYQKPDNLSAGRTLKNVWAFEDSDTVHIGFTTNLLTQKMVLKVEQDSAFRSKFMHPVKVKELNDWSEQPTTQKHMFGLADAPNIIEEYKGKVTDFGWSNYEEQEQTSISQYENLALDYHVKSRSKVPAFITLYDNEAMTQDVGNIAAQHIHEIADALQRVKTGEGGELPDTALLDTSDISAASANLYRKKMVYESLKQTLMGGYQKDKVEDIPKLSKLAKETLQYYKGGSRNSPRKVTDSEAELYTLSNKNYNEQAEEILEHLDEKKMDKFHSDWNDLEEKIALLKPKARNALADHAIWLKTSEAGNESKATALGAPLSTYDKTNVHSALWFEMTTALCIDGMGAVIPNDLEYKDERDKLLDKWIKDQNSLIYQSIAPFDPFKEEFWVFKDKLDSAGDILGGATAGLESLHKMFPYTRATEITTKAIVSYGMRKLDTSVKWSENFFDTLGKQLNANKTQVAMQMLAARYNLSKSSVLNHAITKKTNLWINQALRQAPTANSNIKTKLVNTNGVFNLKQVNTTTQVAPKMSANLLREIGKLPLGAIVSYFHYINLSGAMSSFSENKSGLNAANMLSAMMGAAGAFGETALGLRAIATKTMPTNHIVARSTQHIVFKALASKAFIRITGYGGALVEAGIHVWDGMTLKSNGDKDAANWSYAAGATLGVGGFIMTAGTITGIKAAAAGASLVPGVGWIVAGILLIGIGILCVIQKVKSTNTPFQIWLNRSCLGVNNTKVGLPYLSVAQETQGYAVVCYSARKLEELPSNLQDAEHGLDWKYNSIAPTVSVSTMLTYQLFHECPPDKGIADYAETDWNDNMFSDDVVSFLIFLPGYDINNSQHRIKMFAYDEWSVDGDDYKEATPLNVNTSVNIISHQYTESGLLIHLDKKMKDWSADSVRLEIDYWPNKASLNTKVTSNLFLDG
ncbi:T6SS effector BTH_I2691 family protein [Kangiella spongicola]|uniref:Toxin VasX N-terminal region domain-containing protein n=1 Tax=Kangiella spongicola TaxID=796379 RepID=A0A318D2V7_9GAMM|nr:T6SS effector BTH_I2691 family protein [Kangiella spongicola]PXF63602.1 hypothetical protein DL796_00145 [Kangiella spongicola]